MSRRKQTKPFKVEDEIDPKIEKKTKLRRILPKQDDVPAVDLPSQCDMNSEQFSDDGGEDNDTAARRSKRHAKCNQCGKILASALSLARHRLTHSEKKPYQCPKCDASFKTSSNMHRHLRIHYREVNGEQEIEIPPKPPVPRASNLRSPRQNIRTPNKFKEFDVHLVGVGLRASIASSATNARSYSKPKEVQVTKCKSSSDTKNGKSTIRTESADSGRQSANGSCSGDDLPEFNASKRKQSSQTAPAKIDDSDLVCHVCSKTFISKFGLLTHSVSHPDVSTMCNLCNQSFATHKGLVMHNIIVHKIVENKKELDTLKTSPRGRGFQDLVSIEFSADKFPLIAESACSQLHHNHPDRDIQHIFVCKRCDKAFPLLQSLVLHVNKAHNESKEKESQRHEIDLFLEAVGLNMQEKLDKVQTKSCEKENSKRTVKNGTDDDAIYASESVATDNVPNWFLDEPDMDVSNYKNENEVTPRPRITLKIVRRKSSPGSAVSNIDDKGSDSQENSEDYFIDIGASDKKGKRSGDSGKKSGKDSVADGAATMRFGSAHKQNEQPLLPGERSVYWCRICNYSSHEKSALVRHLLTHSGIRPYFCKLCNYAFTTKANCERHVRKRHNCNERADLDASVQCDWEMLKKAPRDDIYMITGSNSSCPVCSKSFPCNNDLKEHLKVHEERLFICQLCNIRCTTRNNCVRHILHKHPGIPHQEANNIITFAGSRNKDLHMRKLSDFVKDKPTIDISRGSLGGRKIGKSSSNPLKFKLKRPSATVGQKDQPMQKKKKFEKLGPTIFSNHDDDSINTESASSTAFTNVPVLESSGDKDSGLLDNCEMQYRPKTAPALIPLLKIKAYNDAVAGSYANMLSMYQGLNFFSNILDYSKNASSSELNECTTELDSRLMMDPQQKTAFVCHSCSSAFESEDEFNCHVASCTENEAENRDALFPVDEYQIFNRSDRIKHGDKADTETEESSEYPSNTGPHSDKYVMNEVASDDWMTEPENTHQQSPEQAKKRIKGTVDDNILLGPPEQDDSLASVDDMVNLSQSTSSSTPTRDFESEFQNVGDWVDNVLPHSPTSNKSASTPTQSDYSTPFITDGPRVFASNKESSYVEDSLLMSMFGDNNARKDRNEIANLDESSMQDNIMTVSRYSSSFPTMVNMDNPTMTRIKYQAGSQYHSSIESAMLEEKVLVPSKGRFYTARKCPQCDKTFPWASSLRRHIMTHTGLKLYMCRLCKMRFTTRSNLIRHVYRRHGMAKQHPDFASCLAKLHPSDTLLREVEADVRRRIDVQKKTSRSEDVEMDADSNLDDDEYMEEVSNPGRKRAIANDFQSMLEEDPETLLVDLDYSPRDDLPLEDNKKTKMKLVVRTTPKKKVLDALPIDNAGERESLIIDEEGSTEASQEEDEEQEQPIDMSLNIASMDDETYEEALPQDASLGEQESYFHGGKHLRLRSSSKSLTGNKEHEEKVESIEKSPDSKKKQSFYKSVLKPKIRNKQSTQFVCGLCKKIFKTVPDLISHLDMHDVPHSWHCPVCGVPFTNKYNCQRHLTRRHARSDVEPLYVEDSKHGPRTARGHPRKTPVPPEDGNTSINSV